MKNSLRNNPEPIEDVSTLKQRIRELEQSVAESRRAEEALRESETKYRLAFESASDGIFTIDIHGKISSITPSVEKQLGYKVEELINRPIQDLNILTSESLARAVSDVMQVLSGVEIKGAVYELIAKDGTRKIEEVTGTPMIQDGRIIGVTAVVRDITERKQAEEALKKSEELYRILSENSPSMIYLLDVEGNVLVVNQKSAAMFGVKSDAIIGRNIRDLFPERIAERHKQAVDKLLRDGNIIHSELSEPFPTGERWIDARIVPVWNKENSKIIAVLGISHDITDRRQIEEALRESEDNFRGLADELAVIAEIGQVIGSTLEIDEVYEQFAAEARKLIPFDRISVNLINPDGKSFTTAYVSGLDISDRRPGSIVPIAGSVSEIFMQRRSGLIIHVDSPEDLVRQFPGVTISLVVRAGIRSMIGVPLIYRDEVIGVLHFRLKKTNAYTEKDLRLAEKIGAQIAGAIANAQLFTDRKRIEEEIREMSLRDQLTDLYNRRGFITLAEQQIRAANRAKRVMLLTFIDLDGLKGINDTLGHEEGDRALIDAANALRQTFRESDVITRLGGDEFAVLSVDTADMNPEDLSKRLQENIDASNAKETRPYKLAMSWGTAVYDPGSPMSLDKLLFSADERMYSRKKTKPNQRN